MVTAFADELMTSSLYLVILTSTILLKQEQLSKQDMPEQQTKLSVCWLISKSLSSSALQAPTVLITTTDRDNRRPQQLLLPDIILYVFLFKLYIYYILFTNIIVPLGLETLRSY